MAIDPATIEFYQTNAPRYTLGFGQAPSRHLDPFLDRLARGASVLELGCGGGHDSARIAERGFSLDATDGTPAMVRKANERFDVGARLLRFHELDAVAEYDAVWAHACLLHVARADLPSVLASIRRALRPVAGISPIINWAEAKAGTCSADCTISPTRPGSKTSITPPASQSSPQKSMPERRRTEHSATGWR